MALCDKLRDVVVQARTTTPIETSDDSPHSDDWAFRYITASYLQPIMEAFDEEVSGYITTSAVNHFVDSLPAKVTWR